MFTTGYAYADGQLQRKVLPDGQSLRYHYHEQGKNRGQLRAITRESLLGLQQETLVGEIDTDSSDGSWGYLSHNGLRTQRTYQADGRISNIEIGGALRLAYRFDASGRIVGIEQNGFAQRYQWQASQLTAADTLAGRYRFDYDPMGNRTEKQETDEEERTRTTEYRYPVAGEGNRLMGTRDGARESGNEASAQNYRYSATGAPLETDRNLRYEYNVDQRPVRVYENNGLKAEYAYNGFGERVRKVVYQGGQQRVTYYLYDGHTLSAEIDADGREQRHTVYLQNQPVLHLIGEQTYAVHGDHLGTPRLVTDRAGEPVWSADYAPFGEARVRRDDIDFQLRLPGQYHDAETGTHYNYLRDYDPATGRYLTSDPVGLKGGLNTYAYLGGDPLSGSDRRGLAPDDGLNSETGESPIAFIQRYIEEQGQSAVDRALGGLAGEDFEALAGEVLTQVPAELEALATENPAYADLDLSLLKPQISGAAATDMAYALMIMVAVENGLDFIIKKPTVWNVLGGLAAQQSLLLALKAYFLYEFGQEGLALFNSLRHLSGDLSTAAQDGYDCDDVDVLAQQTAMAIADFALAAPGQFGPFRDKFTFGDRGDGGNGADGNNGDGGNNNNDKDDDGYDYSKCKGTVMIKGNRINVPKCSPTAGRWSNEDRPGNSVFRPAPGSELFLALQESSQGQIGIRFQNGYPVFEPLALVDGNSGQPIIVNMPGLTGNNNKDFKAADEAYASAIGVPGWRRPARYTWHHHEDCQTMVLVPTEVHSKVRHQGGASHIRNGTC